jgi:cobalt-zinc-cadmium efflux system membrane fusion protein
MKPGIWAVAMALMAGCGPHEHGDHPHPHEPGGHGEAAQPDEHEDEHGHGHGGEGATEAVTLWGEKTQLFVEFPALVVGEDSPFAAHLTGMSDHLAVAAGKVTAELSGGSGPVERFAVDAPSVAGIFRPVVRPTHAGKRQLTVRLESGELTETHDLGEFVVFQTRAEADAAAPEEEEDPGAISYLLEQQWRVRFGLERVEARPMRPSVPAFAMLALPSQAETVVTAPREGRVLAVDGRFPAVGDAVEDGAVIAALSSAAAGGADLASLDLAVEQAAIRVQAGQREVARVRPLVAQGVLAQRRLDEARSAAAEAQAALRSARRQRESRGVSQQVAGRADTLDLPSPLAGTVSEVYVAEGTWVAAGQPIARVVKRGELWLEAGVPEAYVGRITQVAGAWFRLAGVSGVFQVGADALIAVGAEVDAASRTLPVRFRLNDPDERLFAGMAMRAHLLTGPPVVAAAVPVSALVDDGGVDVVYVQTGGESFARRPVRLGIRDGAYVEVTEGVAPGEWVVSRGPYSVKLASTSTAEIGHGHAH